MLDLSYWRAGLWPNSWWWLRIILPYSELFYHPACEHDTAYDKWWDNIYKQIADYEFYIDCKTNCNNNLQRVFVVIYYITVTLFWFIFFNYRKDEHIEFSN